MLSDPRFDKMLYEQDHLSNSKRELDVEYAQLVPLNLDYKNILNDRYGLHPDHITGERAPWDTSKMMFYVKRPSVFRLLNETVGYAGWGTEIMHPPQFKAVKGKYECVMSIGLSIFGIMRVETGVSTSPDLGMAIMGAFTKGLKRAFSSLGNAGGLMLWNDDFDKDSYSVHFAKNGKLAMPRILESPSRDSAQLNNQGPGEFLPGPFCVKEQL